MRKPSTGRAKLLAVLPILMLGACGTPTPAPSSNVLAGVLKPVPNYSRAPCDMQRAWAAHNSRVASIEQVKTVVYKAPCDVDPRPKPAPAAQQPVKTSGPVPEVDSDRARRVADLGVGRIHAPDVPRASEGAR